VVAGFAFALPLAFISVEHGCQTASRRTALPRAVYRLDVLRVVRQRYTAQKSAVLATDTVLDYTKRASTEGDLFSNPKRDKDGSDSPRCGLLCLACASPALRYEYELQDECAAGYAARKTLSFLGLANDDKTATSKAAA
jgi:hypothetical protein